MGWWSGSLVVARQRGLRLINESSFQVIVLRPAHWGGRDCGLFRGDLALAEVFVPPEGVSQLQV